jgi:hypothetical protein
MHDPVEGVWWDLQVKEAPAWAVSGARKGKDLHKGGNRRSHRPTSREMEGIREGGPSGGRTRPIHRTRPGRGVPESGPSGMRSRRRQSMIGPLLNGAGVQRYSSSATREKGGGCEGLS